MIQAKSETLIFWAHRDPEGPGGVVSTERMKLRRGAWWPPDLNTPAHCVRDLAALGMQVRKGRARRYSIHGSTQAFSCSGGTGVCFFIYPAD